MQRRRERIEEEFELGSEDEALQEYSYIKSVISVNYNLIADELSKLGNFQSGLAIDIGTGLGDLAIEIGRRYPKLTIIGIDISQKATEIATNKIKAENLNNINFQLGDVHNIPFQDKSADLVVSHGSIHHWKDLNKAFLEIYRILKPGALVYLADLRRDAPGEIVKEVEKKLPSKGYINSIRASYTAQELKEKLAQLEIKNFEITDQRFSKSAILKNKERLRKVTMRSADYSKLSQAIVIKNEP